MIKPPPAPAAIEEDLETVVDDTITDPATMETEDPEINVDDQIVIPEVEVPAPYVPRPSVFAENATIISKELKKFLNFVQIMDGNHGFSNFEGCVSCYYDFQKLNFNLEADSIFYLNLAADLRNYISDLSADRVNAEI